MRMRMMLQRRNVKIYKLLYCVVFVKFHGVGDQGNGRVCEWI